MDIEKQYADLLTKTLVLMFEQLGHKDPARNFVRTYPDSYPGEVFVSGIAVIRISSIPPGGRSRPISYRVRDISSTAKDVFKIFFHNELEALLQYIATLYCKTKVNRARDYFIEEEKQCL